MKGPTSVALSPIFSAERKWFFADDVEAHGEQPVSQRIACDVRVLQILPAILIPRSPSRYCQNS